MSTIHWLLEAEVGSSLKRLLQSLKVTVGLLFELSLNLEPISYLIACSWLSDRFIQFAANKSYVLEIIKQQKRGASLKVKKRGIRLSHFESNQRLRRICAKGFMKRSARRAQIVNSLPSDNCMYFSTVFYSKGVFTE